MRVEARWFLRSVGLVDRLFWGLDDIFESVETDSLGLSWVGRGSVKWGGGLGRIVAVDLTNKPSMRLK